MVRVLVVDDHEVVRQSVRSVLRQSGYDVCGEAVDGRDALEKARQLKPDTIVMDVSMPNLNGLEATRLIRSVVPETEVLIMSQHDSPAMAREAFKAGARGYVVKSSMGRDLLPALDKVSRHETYFDHAIQEITARSGSIDAQEILQRSAALEQALRESEELYRSTFDLAAMGVAHVSPDGRWLRVNKKLCEIVGYSEEELLRMRFQEITHPEDLPADLAETDKVITGAISTFSMEKRYIRKDGSPVWVHLTVSGARDAGGQLKHFISIVEDISTRREDDVARSRLAAIVQSSDDAIVSKDLNGIIKSWNAGAERIFEFTAAEAIGQPITIIIPPELRDEEKEILKRLGKGERIEHFGTIRRTKSGKRLNISVTISPVRDSRGKIVGASKVARDITERKLAEEAERRSEARLELALEASRAGFFEWDIVNRRGQWNSQLTAIYDFTPAGEGITAAEWNSLFHPDDRIRLAQEYEEVLERKDEFHFEFRALRSNHPVRWISSRGRVIRDENGKPIRLIGIHVDITQRRQAEEALHREEQQFRVLADSIAELCWMAHPDGSLFWYNQRWFDYTGTCLEEMKGDGWRSVHDPAILPEVIEKWSESIRTGQPLEMVFPLRAADGTFRPFLTRVRPLKDENGKVLRWFGTNTDIAAQREIQEALRQSEAGLRAAFTQTYSLLVLLELDGTIIEANQAALQAAGRKREEVSGRKFWEPWWSPLPDEVARLKTSVQKTAAGEVVQEECYFCLADGTRRFAHRTLTPVRDDHGNVTMLVATGIDLTEQKQLRDELEARVNQRTHELKAKNKALLEQTETVRELTGKLLQTQDEERRRLARELHDSAGQLVAALQMHLDPMKAQADKINSEFAEGIRQSLGFVEQLSRELRTVSYLLHPPLLDETGLPSALSWYVEGFAERSKIDVELELSPDLGRLPRDTEITIFRIVQEGLTNIHRHAESKHATIKVLRKDKEQEVCLEIRDYGKGMPGTNSTGSNKYGSNTNGSSAHPRSGVGIQGMRERVRQLGGQFEIKSTERGTTVIAGFPVNTASSVISDGTAVA